MFHLFRRGNYGPGGNGSKLLPFSDTLTTDGTDFTNSRGPLCFIRAYPCDPWFDSLRLRFPQSSLINSFDSPFYKTNPTRNRYNRKKIPVVPVPESSPNQGYSNQIQPTQAATPPPPPNGIVSLRETRESGFALLSFGFAASLTLGSAVEPAVRMCFALAGSAGDPNGIAPTTPWACHLGAPRGFIDRDTRRAVEPEVRISLRESPANAGDPNGIRTRVTAVKGRCPRPLDDRVFRPAKAAQYPG